MIAVDTNILVYAHREEASLHTQAGARLQMLAQGRIPWGLPVFVLSEFLRVMTHPRFLDRPHTLGEACETLRRLLASPSLVVLHPGPRFAEMLLEAVVEARASGNLVFDAQIVALCREHGVETLLTEDRDFARFQDLRLERL